MPFRARPNLKLQDVPDAAAAALPAPTTQAELEAGLEALEAARAGHREALELLPERERGLLEMDAPDAAFGQLDMQRKRLRHQLDKLDQREGTLLLQLEQAQMATLEAAWNRLVEDYSTLAEEAAAQGSTLRGTMERLQALAAAADGYVRAGHVGTGLPSLSRPINWAEFSATLQSAQAARHLHFNAAGRPPLVTVEFVRTTDLVGGSLSGPAYPRGVQAGFEPGTAWRLVEGGFAKWVDRPPPDPRPAKPVSTQERRQ